MERVYELTVFTNKVVDVVWLNALLLAFTTITMYLHGYGHEWHWPVDIVIDTTAARRAHTECTTTMPTIHSHCLYTACRSTLLVPYLNSSPLGRAPAINDYVRNFLHSHFQLGSDSLIGGFGWNPSLFQNCRYDKWFH